MWGSSKYERNGSRAKLTWHTSGITYFACDPLRSYFDEPHKNEIYFLPKLGLSEQHLANHLRNKFHFSEVHRSMNAVGSLQSKWHPNIARDPLRSYFDELFRKNEIHFLYLHFFTPFCALLSTFSCNVCKLHCEQNQRIRSLRSTAVVMTWR